MSRVTFNIAAKCDKAGRAQNQDNFWICPNLEKPGDNSAVGTDTFIDLSDKKSTKFCIKTVAPPYPSFLILLGSPPIKSKFLCCIA